jgi:tight adherence protein B
MWGALAVTAFATYWVSRTLLSQVMEEKVRAADRFERLAGRWKAPGEPSVAEAPARPARRRRTWAGRLDQALRSAGIRLNARELLLLLGVTVIGFTGGGLLLGIGYGPGLASVVVLPVVVVKTVQVFRTRRQLQLSRQVGEAMALMANSLRSGYSLLQALETVSWDLPEPMQGELRQVLKETAVSIDVETALRRLVDRNHCADLELMVTAILIQRQIGGNLAEVLDNIGATIRERTRIAGEVRTLTAQGRMSGLIIGGLPFALGGVLMMINPDYISVLFTHEVGRIILGIALAGQLVGLVFIRRLVDLRM